MKKKLSFKEYVYVASMLFGLFFGAGNLIFPIHMGQMAGANMWVSVLGFLVTGVGLPLLGVAALGISRSTGLFDLSSKAGKPYGLFFTCLLYLTIGPFLAIPRCPTTPFTVGLEQILPNNGRERLYLFLFTLAFCLTATIAPDLSSNFEKFHLSTKCLAISATTGPSSLICTSCQGILQVVSLGTLSFK